MSRGIEIICKARNIFKLDTLLTLYYSFIQPYNLLHRSMGRNE